MADLAELNLLVQSDQVAKSIDRLNALPAAGAKAEQAADRLKQKFNDANSMTGKFNELLNRTTQTIGGQFRSALTSVGGAIAGAFALKHVIDNMLEFESALIRINKVIRYDSTQALREFGNEIIRLSAHSRTTASELLAIADSGAKLGLRGQALLDFTDSVAKLAFTIHASNESTSQGVARIIQSTHAGADEIQHLTDVIKVLGVQSLTGGEELLNTSALLARSTAQYKLTAEQVVVLGASLSSLGGRAESGIGAVTEVLTGLDQALQGTARDLRIVESITGKTSDELRGMLKSAPLQALIVFGEGLNRITKQGGNARAALETMGMSADEVLKILPALTGANSKLADAQEQAAHASEEHGKQLVSTSTQIKIFFNALDAVTIGLDKTDGAAKKFIEDLTAAINIVSGNANAMDLANENALELADNLAVLAEVGKAGWEALVVGAGLFATALKGVKDILVDMIQDYAKLELNISGKGAAVVPPKARNTNVGTAGEYLQRQLGNGPQTTMNLGKPGDGGPSLLSSMDPFGNPKGNGQLSQQEIDQISGSMDKSGADRMQGALNKLAEAKAKRAKQLDDQFIDYLLHEFGYDTSGTSGTGTDAPAKAAESLAQLSSGLDKVAESAEDAGKKTPDALKATGQALDFVNQKAQRARDQITQMFQDMIDESKVLGMSNDEREKTINMIQLEKLAREGLIKDMPGLLNQYDKEFDKMSRLRRLTGVAEDVGQAWTNSFTDFATGAKKAGEAAMALGNDIQRAIINRLIAQPLGDAIAGGLGSIFRSFFPGPGALPAGSAGVGGGPWTGSALGNIFSMGSLIPFAYGGVVGGPTAFPMRGGRAGLMGEAGPEAIMPLKRGADGRLGVSTSGSPVTVVINNNTTSKVETREDNGPGGKTITVAIGDMVAQDITGRGKVAQAMESAYGLKRRGQNRG